MTAKAGVAAPSILKLLGLYPTDDKTPIGTVAHINAGERIPLRGGGCNSNTGGGLFSFTLNYDHTASGWLFGFRSAFIL